jgi:hypothetical protein
MDPWTSNIGPVQSLSLVTAQTESSDGGFSAAIAEDRPRAGAPFLAQR